MNFITACKITEKEILIIIVYCRNEKLRLKFFSLGDHGFINNIRQQPIPFFCPSSFGLV